MIDLEERLVSGSWDWGDLDGSFLSCIGRDFVFGLAAWPSDFSLLLLSFHSLEDGAAARQ